MGIILLKAGFHLFLKRARQSHSHFLTGHPPRILSHFLPLRRPEMEFNRQQQGELGAYCGILLEQMLRSKVIRQFLYYEKAAAP